MEEVPLNVGVLLPAVLGPAGISQENSPDGVHIDTFPLVSALGNCAPKQLAAL